MAKTYDKEDETYLAARFRQSFLYNPDTGALLWRIARQGGYAAPGAPAGSVDKDGSMRVCLDGVNYSAARMLYLYQFGFFPKRRIVFRDGNRQNLAWENIRHDRADYAQNKVAVYHREMRALNKQIDRRIAEGTLSERDALREGGQRARGVRAYHREQIRAERAMEMLTRHPHDTPPPPTTVRFGTPATHRQRKPR